MSKNVVTLRAENIQDVQEVLDRLHETDSESEPLHLEIGDLKDLWGQGILPDVAYVAQLLMHLRMKAISENTQTPNSLIVDVDSFINKYCKWNGFSPSGKEVFKTMKARNLYAIVAKLEDKRIWEFASLPRQMSLEFTGG